MALLEHSAGGARDAGERLKHSGCGLNSFTVCSLRFRLSPGSFHLLSVIQLEGNMSSVNWKPFVFGGLASVTAECGE